MKNIINSLIILVVLAVVIIIGLGPGFNFHWLDFKPASCLPGGCFCEKIQWEQNIRQPLNSWTSLAYVFVGLLAINFSIKDPPRKSRNKNPIRNSLVFGLVYGFSLILLGLGSFFFHASLTFSGQFLDLLGMYLMASFFLIYAALRLFKPRYKLLWGSYFSLNSALAFSLISIPSIRNYLFAIIMMTAFLFECLLISEGLKINRRLFYMLMTFLTLAFGIWLTDFFGVLCKPGSPVQGHAIWHVLTAISAGLVYFYYRSEENYHVKF